MSPAELGIQHNVLQFYNNSLLAPTSSEKSVVALIDHCKKYAIEDMLDEREDVKIIGQNPTFENVVDHYKEYVYKTRSEGEWRVRYHGLQQPFSRVDNNLDELGRFSQELALSQSFDFPRSRTSKDGIHAMGLHFVIQNLSTIDSVITNKPAYLTFDPTILVMEASVPHPRRNAQMRIDLGFLGSDNRFHILEHGNSSNKSSKTQKYVGGCKILYRQANEGEGRLRQNRIDGHVVNYEKTEHGYELDIYQPEDLEFFNYIHWLTRKRAKHQEDSLSSHEGIEE